MKTKMIGVVAATMLSTMVLTTSANALFPDVPTGEWFDGAAHWAKGAGIINGIDGKFAPEKYVTRAELAVILQRYDNHKQKMDDGYMGEKQEDKPFIAEVMNKSETQPLAPGLLIVHTADASINFKGALAPASLETLAEVGNPAAFREELMDMDGIIAVYDIGAIAPGGMEAINIEEMDYAYKVSVIQMAAGSNDGYALVDSLTMKRGEYQYSSSYDAGFEENSALLSGFDGGQPDSSRGEENLDNGTATDPQAVVTMHDQLEEKLMKVWLK